MIGFQCRTFKESFLIFDIPIEHVKVSVTLAPASMWFQMWEQECIQLTGTDNKTGKWADLLFAGCRKHTEETLWGLFAGVWISSWWRGWRMLYSLPQWGRGRLGEVWYMWWMGSLWLWHSWWTWYFQGLCKDWWSGVHLSTLQCWVWLNQCSLLQVWSSFPCHLAPNWGSMSSMPSFFHFQQWLWKPQF